MYYLIPTNEHAQPKYERIIWLACHRATLTAHRMSGAYSSLMPWNSAFSLTLEYAVPVRAHR